MVIYYKNETNLIKHLKLIRDVVLYKDGGFLPVFTQKSCWVNFE